MDLIKAALKSETYEKGKGILAKESITNDDLDWIGSCVETEVENVGDTAPAVAPLHILYGVACLRYVQQNLDFMGSGMKPQQQQQEATLLDVSNDDDVNDQGTGAAAGASSSAGEDAGDDDGDSDAEEEAEESQPKQMSENELHDLLEIAWECLEVARVIYRKCVDELQPDFDSNESLKVEKGSDLELAVDLLSGAHTDIGDLSLEMGNFADAINDYKSGLQLRKRIFEISSRKIADSNAQLGVAHRYMADEPSTTDAGMHRLLSLTYYVEAARSLVELRRTMIGNSSSSSSSSSASYSPATLPQIGSQTVVEDAGVFVTKLGEELAQTSSLELSKEAVDLGEVIASVRSEIEDGISAVSNPEQAATKTKEMIMKIIGNLRGDDSSQSTTTTGFGNSSSSGGAASASASSSAQMLQPRKKTAAAAPAIASNKRDREDENAVTESAVVGSIDTSSGSGDGNEESSSKKQRVESLNTKN